MNILLANFVILRVYKCGMPIIMTHLIITSVDHGVIGTVGYN